MKCPNCNDRTERTQDFVGMISVMMPSQSWVAKWNEIRTCIPGVYAININHVDQEIEDERREAAREEADNDFIVGDD